ncbi:hypothetical protein RhiXN_12231 [Rhizoctonia solani]|uniref:Uncharacterized protein n=1 Tax=Rhizoctonia solani TaxID=456999 RepID=A0A8H8P7F2_9AGAM|nr:uncharacterized protein RhiXN_12231 [Rhizoctonia solani]QRW26570.1 hypothetical protein RhiXN_12231 [Rhizoctonia solani]
MVKWIKIIFSTQLHGSRHRKRGVISNLSGATDQLIFDQSIHRDDSEHFVCKNNSSGVVNLSIGLLNGKGADQKFEPILVWTNIATRSNVTTKFTPNLTVQVTCNYQATKILCGKMETNAIWSYDLNKLSKMDGVTLWNFVEDNGHSKAALHYQQRLAFGYAQTDWDNLVDSAAWVEVASGEVSRISGKAGQKRFGHNAKGHATKKLVCKNNTDSRANLSIGFVRGDGINQRYEPTMLWTGVGAKSNVAVQFTPVLSAYITRDYKATEMLRGEVETDAIWTFNLDQLDGVTGWNLVEDDITGAFGIEPAQFV